MKGKTRHIEGKDRTALLAEKNTAVWVNYMELADMLNFSQIAEKYFQRKPSWILQRLHGFEVNGKKAMFKPEQYQVLTAALRDIAARLLDAADEIDNAPADGTGEED